MSPRVSLDSASIEAIARRVADLLRGETTRNRLVDAATLAATLGVNRSYVYAHADELRGVRMGDGSKPRLRFDVEASLKAFTCYVSKQSQRPNPSTGAEPTTSPVRRGRRLPNGLPEPGSVLAVRPRSAARSGRSPRRDQRGSR